MRARASGAPGQVRIIGGRLRGSKLAVPGHEGLRPTPARARETLFNWLQPMLVGSHCLDLFAGSGALGIEALSRGAASVCFVERDAGLATALRENLRRLGQEGGRVCCADALEVLARAPGQACDLVFLDPPFAADLWTPVAERLEASAWLAPHAWIHVESALQAPPPLPPGWVLHREGRAGAVRHALYRRRPGDPPGTL